MEAGKRSAWMTHVKKTMKSHKGMKLGAALKLAAKTYKKKTLKGGAEGEGVMPYTDFGGNADVVASRSTGANLTAPQQDAAPVGGRRRSRRHRKSRRGGDGGEEEVMGGRRRSRRHRSRKH